MEHKNMKALLGSYFKGDPKTECYYTLASVRMLNTEKSFFVIIRDYGNNSDGSPMNAVTIVGEDDGTVEKYHDAYTLFRLFVG